MAEVTPTVEGILVQRMAAALQRDLIDNIPLDDPARVNVVQLGKYVGELENKIVLSVLPEHPLGIMGDRVNALAEFRASRSQRYRPGQFPSETLGGSRFRYVFGTVQMRMILKRVTPAEAIPISALVKTRAAMVINNDEDLVGFEDVYGYFCHDTQCSDDYGYASGGEDTAVQIKWIDWISLMTYARHR